MVHSPLLKIERAKQHINDLNRQIGEYLAYSPFHMRIREGQNPPQRMVYVHANPPIPADALALIVGDAVHNLRTALDHICFAMVGDQAPQPARVGFPFVEKAESLGGAINTRQMNVASKHVIDELHALQPYPGGNKYLHAVKAMDERDKHHFVLTVAYGLQFTASQLGSLIGPERVSHVPPDAQIGTSGGFVVPLNADEVTSPFDKEADFQPPFSIGFGQGEAVEAEPAVAVLKKMCVATEDAVIRLAAAFFR